MKIEPMVKNSYGNASGFLAISGLVLVVLLLTATVWKPEYGMIYAGFAMAGFFMAVAGIICAVQGKRHEVRTGFCFFGFIVNGLLTAFYVIIRFL